MPEPLRVSGLYAIADTDTLRRHGITLRSFAEQLAEAGVTLLQLRDKTGAPRAVLEQAALLRAIFPAGGTCRLILNDRADLAALAGFDGVHVGQDDLPVAAARTVMPAGAIVGLSTHSAAQVRAAETATGAARPDYVAIGPVFATTTKADAEPAVGLEGAAQARELTTLPLVAIGGITRENAAQVKAAGADAIAVVGGLLVEGWTLAQAVAELEHPFRVSAGVTGVF